MLISASAFKINFSFLKNKLLLVNFKKPIFLLISFVLLKLIFPLTALNLIIDDLKISSYLLEPILIEIFALILLLNNNFVLIN